MVILSKVEVGYAYTFLRIGYVIASVVGYLFFNESLTSVRIIGIIVICIGVYLISRS
jgi:multidrug transporter EmrE-like cation transporter